MIIIRKLPRIYQNDINKKINNNKKTYHLKYNNNEEVVVTSMNNEDVNKVIDSIFNTTGYAFNINVIIKTRNKTYDTSLIAKRNGYILTLDNDRIRIDDIISIKRKNP